MGTREDGSGLMHDYLRQTVWLDHTRAQARRTFETDQRPVLDSWRTLPLLLRVLLTLCGQKPRDWYSVSGCQGVGGCRYEVWDQAHRLVRVRWQYSARDRAMLAADARSGRDAGRA